MIYYQTHGHTDSQAVILLHSGGMAGEEWQPQIAPLAQRYHLLVPDLPGHGKSPLNSETLTISHMADAVLQMMDAEGIQEANFCGSSMGGAVALWLALKHPGRVKRLVLYRISYRSNSEIHRQVQAMSNPTYWESFGLAAWLSRLHSPQGGTDAWKQVIARVGHALHTENSEHRHHLQDLATICCPVLIITGDRDPVVPLADALDMYRTIANACLWIIPRATHITAGNTWRAPAFAEELCRFYSCGNDKARSSSKKPRKTP